MLIDNWLNQRQDMIVLYCSITGLDSDVSDDSPLASKLRTFCQLLVDYVSTGHFEIYEQLQREASDFGDTQGLSTATDILSAIQKNTESCIAFNDQCEQLSNIQKLQAMLSHIGEILEDRFSLEDRLIELLHNVHRDKVQHTAARV